MVAEHCGIQSVKEFLKTITICAAAADKKCGHLDHDCRNLNVNISQKTSIKSNWLVWTGYYGQISSARNSTEGAFHRLSRSTYSGLGIPPMVFGPVFFSAGGTGPVLDAGPSIFNEHPSHPHCLWIFDDDLVDFLARFTRNYKFARINWMKDALNENYCIQNWLNTIATFLWLWNILDRQLKESIHIDCDQFWHLLEACKRAQHLGDYFLAIFRWSFFALFWRRKILNQRGAHSIKSWLLQHMCLLIQNPLNAIKKLRSE